MKLRFLVVALLLFISGCNNAKSSQSDKAKNNHQIDPHIESIFERSYQYYLDNRFKEYIEHAKENNAYTANELQEMKNEEAEYLKKYIKDIISGEKKDNSNRELIEKDASFPKGFMDSYNITIDHVRYYGQVFPNLELSENGTSFLRGALSPAEAAVLLIKVRKNVLDSKALGVSPFGSYNINKNGSITFKRKE